MAMSACCAWASIRRTASEVPASTHAWLTEPATTYAAPIASAAAAAHGVEMPPAAPIRGGVVPCCACIRSRRASIVGSRTIAGWLSVCPPESASAVTSSAIGISGGPLGLLGGDLARGDQVAEELRRRRRQELRGHLDPRHLGDDPVRRHDPPRGVAVDAVHAVADHRQRQVEIRRGLDQPDARAAGRARPPPPPGPAHPGCGSG